MKVLLVEDDEEKAKRITEFVESEFAGTKVELARSFNSGLRAAIAGSNLIDVMLLDMSMPNYDDSPQEPGGGTPESYAGRDLLAQMRLRGISIPTIVITMFASFGKEETRKSLEQLTKELAEKFAPTFKGVVYYNSMQEGWRDGLKRLLSLQGRNQ
jgi:CheY-like chemotaxis protein